MPEPPFKWCAAKTYRADSVDQAVEMAEGFKAEGRYDWFRGQTRDWPPYSSLFRRQRSNEAWREEIIPLWNRFYSFLMNNPEGVELASDSDAMLAVGQHYGVASPYIDFSTEPSVAGFFACDGPADPEADDSLIFCVNLEDLKRAWENLKALKPQAELDLVTRTVPNLWRLESQHGVFLYVQPGNWDVWYEMDRIVFPRGGPPSYPPRDVIYPANKSSLEILLDHFLMSEKMRKGNLLMREMLAEAGVPITVIEAEPGYFSPSVFRDGALEEHPSWNVDLKAWYDHRAERLEDVGERTVRILLPPDLPGEEVASRLRSSVRNAIGMHKKLRGERVSWSVGPGGVVKGEATNERLETALRWTWDGMRALPYDTGQVALAMSTCASLAMQGLRPGLDRGREEAIAESLFGPCLRVQFGAQDGSYAYAWVSRSALREAWREDLPDLIEPSQAHIFDREESVLLSVYAPRRLFRFEGLAALMAAQIVPWQVLTETGDVAFFSPVRFETFGLP